MAKLVDERVVEMSFDNKKFEENVGETLGTLDKLKTALKFDGAAESFSEIESASEKVDFSELSNSVGSLGDHFSALEGIALGAWERIGSMITDKAMQIIGSVGQMVASVTTDLGALNNVGQGWEKYNDYNQAVQSLVNSTGMDVNEIEGYLSKLMWYADETSFSFTEMVSALSQAALVGADLGNATDMIIGIANATAYAGKEGFAFQSTVRNLMQSYGSGSLQYLDYKSLIGQGTATEELQSQIIKAAEELGTVEAGVINGSNFKDKLKDGWATQEVMELAFSRFGEYTEMAYRMVEEGVAETATEAYELLEKTNHGLEDFQIRAAKSGQEAISFRQAVDATAEAVGSKIMQIFKYVFGNYDEAKQLWTYLSEVLYEIHAAKYDNLIEVLKLFHSGIDGAKSGFSFFWEGMEMIADTIWDLVDAIKEAWEEILPKKTAEEAAHGLYMIAWRFNLMAKNFKDFFSNEERLEKIKVAIQGIAAVVSIFKTTIGAVFKIISSVIGAILGAIRGVKKNGTNAFDSILNVLAKVGEFLVLVAEKWAEIVDAFVSGTAFQAALSWISEKISSIKETVASFISSIWPTVQNILKAIGTGALYALGGVLVGIGSALGFLYEKLQQVAFAIGEFIQHIQFMWRLSSGQFDEGIPQMVDLGWLSSTDLKIIEFFKKIRETWEAIRSFFVDIYDTISTSVSGIVEKFKELVSTKVDEFGEGVSSGFTSAKDALSGFWETIKGAGKTVGAELSELWESIKQVFLEHIDLSKFEKITEAFTKFWDTLRGGADAVRTNPEDSAIIKILKEVWDFLKIAIPSIAGLIADLSNIFIGGVSEMFADGNLKNTFEGINAGLGTGLLVQLIGLFKNLGKATDFSSEGNPFTSILDALKEFKDNVTDVDKIKAIGVVILELAGSLLVLSLVDTAKLSIAMIALSTVLKEIKILLTLAQGDKFKVFTGAAASIQKIVTSVALLAGSIALLAAIAADKGLAALVEAVGAITVILVELGVFAGILGALNKKGIVGELPDIGSELLLMAGAVGILALALKSIAEVDDPVTAAEAIKKLLEALLIYVAGVATVQKVLGGVSGMAGMGFGLLMIANALVVLVGVMKLLEFIDFSKIQNNMKVLALALAGITLMLTIISSQGGWNALGAAVAIQLVVNAIASLIAVLLLFGVAIKKVGYKETGMAVAVFGLFIVVIGAALGLLSLIAPAVLMVGGAFALLGIGIYALVSALLLLVPAMAAIILGADVLLAGLEVLSAVIVQLIVSILGGLLTGIQQLSTLIIDTVIVLVDQLVIRLLDWLIEILPTLIEKVVVVIIAFLKGLNDSLEAHEEELAVEIARLIDLVISIAVEAIVKALALLWESLDEKTGIPEFLSGIWEKISTFWNEKIKPALDKVAEVAKFIWDNLLKPIVDFVVDVFKTISEVVGKVFEVLKGIFDWVVEAVSTVISTVWGIIQSIVDFIKGVGETITTLIGDILGFFSGMMSDIGGILTGDLDFWEVAKGWINDLWEGALSIAGKVISLIDGMLEGIAESLGILDWYNTAKEWIQGLINGVLDFANSVIEGVKNMAKSVATAWNKFWGIESPSKVMRQSGRFLDEGLMLGINDMAGDVADAAMDMGEDTLDAVNTAMDAVMDVMESDDTYSPTITPVYDLSALYSGSEEINSLLDSDPTALSFKMGDEEGLQSVAADINRSSTTVADAIDDVYTKLSDFMTKVKGEFGDNTVTLNVYGTEGQDVEELADIVSYRINAALQRERAVYS